MPKPPTNPRRCSKRLLSDAASQKRGNLRGFIGERGQLERECLLFASTQVSNLRGSKDASLTAITSSSFERHTASTPPHAGSPSPAALPPLPSPCAGHPSRQDHESISTSLTLKPLVICPRAGPCVNQRGRRSRLCALSTQRVCCACFFRLTAHPRKQLSWRHACLLPRWRQHRTRAAGVHNMLHALTNTSPGG